MIVKRRYKIGGIYRFPSNTSNEYIIDHILKDFSLKCAKLIEEYYDPEVGLSSLCTYEIFRKRWELEDPGDVSSNGEEIYSEIPGEICERYITMFLANDGVNVSPEVIREMFSSGEFPIVKIWKGYHEGKDEIHATYSIMR